jgi:hypothetical protein
MKFFETQKRMYAISVEFLDSGSFILTLRNRAAYNLVRAFLRSYKCFSPDPEMKIGRFNYTEDKRKLAFSITATNVSRVFQDITAAKIIDPVLCKEAQEYMESGNGCHSLPIGDERTALIGRV